MGDFVATGYAVKPIVDPDLLDAGRGCSIGVDEKTLSDLLVGCRDVASFCAAEWFTKQMDGKWVLQSGAISAGETSILSCMVEGAGALSFKWKVDDETFEYRGKTYQVDMAAVIYDDERVEFGGNQDWTEVTLDKPDIDTSMSKDGTSVTFTFAPPQGNQGFVKVLID